MAVVTIQVPNTFQRAPTDARFILRRLRLVVYSNLFDVPSVVGISRIVYVININR